MANINGVSANLAYRRVAYQPINGVMASAKRKSAGNGWLQWLASGENISCGAISSES